MNHQSAFQLTTISLLPLRVTCSSQTVKKLLEFPRFRLEVWQDAVKLNDTEDISFYIKEAKNSQMVIDLKGVCFRYQHKELFSRIKTVKLHIQLWCLDLKGENSELIQEFNLTLSQHSYEYSNNEINIFREHSIGLKNKSYLHYKIQCDYDVLLPFEAATPELKINEKQQANPSKRDTTLLGTFPVSGGEDINIVETMNKEEEKDQMFVEKWSDVFIETSKLKPLYKSDIISNQKIYIKLEKSIVQMEGQTEISTISEVEKMKEQTKDVSFWFLILFIGTSIPILIFLMHPYRKV